MNYRAAMIHLLHNISIYCDISYQYINTPKGQSMTALRYDTICIGIFMSQYDTMSYRNTFSVIRKTF